MLSWLSKKLLRWSGWNLISQPPQVKKYVVIVAPHTSNWDFWVFILIKFIFRMHVSFIGKHTIFVGPIGWVLKKWGGIPINRSAKHNVVDTIVEEFDKRDELIFALSPEGTRSFKDHWKSGFYYIALNANVPLQLCYIDSKTKSVGFGPLITLTGDQNKDVETLRAFYQDKAGIRPELFSTIKFREKSS
ncbi:MAG: lysophospholipid acyltransferase family protein [Kangiellaceae bacterium]|nr:lysophospholipid acyltransferase family protein [Kangiellaceae bacterium]MCW9000774.1 lysophospholipid acyltransferase family protein [Kangiellaceae bacterium]